MAGRALKGRGKVGARDGEPGEAKQLWQGVGARAGCAGHPGWQRLRRRVSASVGELTGADDEQVSYCATRRQPAGRKHVRRDTCKSIPPLRDV